MKKIEEVDNQEGNDEDDDINTVALDNTDYSSIRTETFQIAYLTRDGYGLINRFLGRDYMHHVVPNEL